MENEIINRVANSTLESIDLESFLVEGERVQIDLKTVLYQDLILREADFRLWVKEMDWESFKNKLVAINCSVDVIIPQWAYMIIASKLSPYAKYSCRGSLDKLEEEIFHLNLKQNINPEDYKDRSIVVKGCFDKPVPDGAYVWITNILTPHVKSIMYGEPCSTVPVFKNPKKNIIKNQ